MDKRFWYPSAFTARNGRRFKVSFLIAEEATWDHRLHDLDGRERAVQVCCDAVVGTQLMGSDADEVRMPRHQPLHANVV